MVLLLGLLETIAIFGSTTGLILLWEHSSPARGIVSAALGLALVLRAAGYPAVRRRPSCERVLILGGGFVARRIADAMEAGPASPGRIVGMVPEKPDPTGPLLPYALPWGLQDLGRILEETAPERIIVALTKRRGNLPMPQLLEARSRGVVVEDGVDAYERLTGEAALEALNSSTLIFAKDFRLPRLYLTLSRGLGLVVCALSLILLAPLFGLISLAILLDSGRPIFFVHERLGLGDRPFKLIKFRTLHPSRERRSQWIRDNSDRVTRVGRWLRRFRLDELPQLLNILRGEMTLIGPRPHPVSNREMFTENIPFYLLRSMIRPGVTGWAQVKYGYANGLDEEREKMRYDLFYLRHLSFRLDCRILLGTLKTVLLGAHQEEGEDRYPTFREAGGPGYERLATISSHAAFHRYMRLVRRASSYPAPPRRNSRKPNTVEPLRRPAERRATRDPGGNRIAPEAHL